MRFLLTLGITAFAMMMLSYLNIGFHVNGFTAALVAAFVFGIISSTLGLLMKVFFHVISVGVLFILGLSFIIRFIVICICLNITDNLMDSIFIVNTKSLIISGIVIALAGTLAEALSKDKDR